MIINSTLRLELPTVKECIAGQATLICVSKEELWYECENGLRFPIPHSDWSGAIFIPKDKAILFMRWIRKHLAFLEDAYKVQETKASECDGSTMGS